MPSFGLLLRNRPYFSIMANFNRAYRANRETGNETALESSLIYEPLQIFCDDLKNQPWEGMPSKLLKELDEIAGEKKTKEKDWPSNAKILRSELQRLAPNLRAVGVGVEFLKRTKAGGKVRLIPDYVCETPTPHAPPTSKDPQPLPKGVGNGGGVGHLHTYSCGKEVHLDF